MNRYVDVRIYKYRGDEAGVVCEKESIPRKWTILFGIWDLFANFQIFKFYRGVDVVVEGYDTCR